MILGPFGLLKPQVDIRMDPLPHFNPGADKVSNFLKSYEGSP